MFDILFFYSFPLKPKLSFLAMGWAWPFLGLNKSWAGLNNLGLLHPYLFFNQGGIWPWVGPGPFLV